MRLRLLYLRYRHHLLLLESGQAQLTNQKGVILAGPSRNYLVLGLESSATNGLSAINGSAIARDRLFHFNFRCPFKAGLQVKCLIKQIQGSYLPAMLLQLEHQLH